jgi:hypothetical protein
VTDDLGAGTFKPHQDTTFTLVLDDGGGVPLLLVDVDEGDEQPGAPRPDPVSLTFTAPAGTVVPQGMYVLRHDELGELGLFLVPREPAGDGLPRLEALFN